MDHNSVLFKKVFGCLIGGAIGDAMGGPYEGMHADFIRQLNGGGLIPDLHDYHLRPADFFQPEYGGGYAWSFAPGTYTDDTYFATLLGRCIIEKGGRITCDDLGDYWVKHCNVRCGWYAIQASYWRLIQSNRPARSASQGNMGDNSSPMCIGPVGVINACDPFTAALDAYDVSSIMHEDYSREAAGMLAAAIAEAMKPDATVESVIAAALDNLPGGKLSPLYPQMQLALECVKQAADVDELTKLFYERLNVQWARRPEVVSAPDGRHSDSVDSLEAVPCALAMFAFNRGDYAKTISAAASFGRDCDTIACMAGYVAGAFQGTDGIPQRWIDTVLAANPQENIKDIAEKITGVLLAQNERRRSQCDLLDQMA